VISQSRVCLHLNRRAHFAEPAVTRTRLREPRRLPPDSVRTPLLAEETRFTCAKVGPVSNIGALGGTPPRSPLVSFRLRRLSLTRRCARGVPTRLALPLVPANDRCDYESWGLKPEFPTSAVTKGRTGTPVSSSRFSSARGCRLCPRSLIPTGLAPSRNRRPERDQRPSEEPCPLR